jgi:hypothetical protein
MKKLVALLFGAALLAAPAAATTVPAALQGSTNAQWVAALGATPYLRFYSGAVPVNADAPATGTVLVEGHFDGTKTPTLTWTANADGTTSLSGLPTYTTGSNQQIIFSQDNGLPPMPLRCPIIAAGTATYWRWIASDGVTTLMQGTYADGGDMVSNTHNYNVSLGDGSGSTPGIPTNVPQQSVILLGFTLKAQ